MITLLLVGADIESSHRLKESTNKDTTSLTLTKVKLSDAGEYSVFVTNEHGTANFSVKVIVIGGENTN